MTKKTFALVYVLVSSLANILFTAVVVAVFVGISFAVLRFGFHAQPETYGTALFGSFTFGLVVSFIAYSRISMKIIKKYKLDERYGGGRPVKKNSASVSQDEEKKTVLPSSVLEDEEDEKWRE